MKSIFSMNGAEKAAALMIVLGSDTASEIMKHLDEKSIDIISIEIAKLESLPPGEKDDLIGEFIIDLKKSKNSVSGGENKAKDLITKAFGRERADEILKKVYARDADKQFDFLNDIELEVLYEFLKDEHNQAIALIFTYIKPEISAKLLKQFTVDRSKDIAIRIAKLKNIAPEIVLNIAKVLKEKYKKFQANENYNQIEGINSIVDILNKMNGSDEKKIMDHFDTELPGISKMIREKIFTFENIINLSNNEMRILIDEINNDTLIGRSLKGAGDSIRFNFFRNMSQNRAADLLTEIDEMGPIPLSEIEKARGEVMTIVKTLNDNGVIIVNKENEILVE